MIDIIPWLSNRQRVEKERKHERSIPWWSSYLDDRLVRKPPNSVKRGRVSRIITETDVINNFELYSKLASIPGVDLDHSFLFSWPFALSVSYPSKIETAGQ